jgi:DNA-directed RNA polymerase III subunit RPC5
MAEQERAGRREGAGAAGKDGAPATASSAGARAIHMSIKSADSGGGELTTETMADRLRTVQTEAWSKLKYEDEDSIRSWTVFSNNLVYRSAHDDKGSKEGDKGKGKERETTAIEVVDSSSDSEQLESRWEEEDLLKAISSMKDGPEGSQQQQQQQPSRAGSSVEVKKEGASASSAAASAASKKTPNAKGKSVAFKSTDSMDID